MERVSQAYPRHRLSGVEAPTSRRPTYLAYVTTERDFVTVLIDPVTAEILGELPQDPLIESVQRLHFDLMGGRTGRMINGVGAVCILVMCATGLVIWWPGTERWRRGFVVDVSRDARRMVWELHRAIGIWTVAFLAMFAITGLSFVFPSQFRAAVHAISPITVTRDLASIEAPMTVAWPTWADVIARARQERPGEHVARVCCVQWPRRIPDHVSNRSPTPAGSRLSLVVPRSVFRRCLAAPQSSRTIRDIIVAWVIRCTWAALVALGGGGCGSCSASHPHCSSSAA